MVTLITDQLFQSSLEDPVANERPFLLQSTNFNFRGNSVSGRSSVAVCEERHVFQNTPITFKAPSSELAVTPSVITSCDPNCLLTTNVSCMTFSPTEVPPAAKRHRRSASIPGSSPTESRLLRRASRHRQSVALIRPSVIHPELFLAEVKQQPIENECDSANVVDNLTTVDSARSSDCPDSRLFTFSGLSLPQSASADCSLDAAARESPSSKPLSFSCELHWSDNSSAFVGSFTEKQTADDLLLQRCQSQPSVFLMRIGSLKRRRDEEVVRPRLDFQKMRQTAFMGSERTLCTHSQSSLLHNVCWQRADIDAQLSNCPPHDFRHKMPSYMPEYESQYAIANEELAPVQVDSESDDEQALSKFADHFTADHSDSTCSGGETSSEEDDMPVVGITDQPAGQYVTENRRNSVGDENSGIELLFGGDIDLDLIENN